MELRVYGPGCANCERLERHTREAVAGLGRTIEITKVTDIVAIAEAGVMRTPALGVDASLLFQGRVPPVDELTTLLADAFSREGQAG
jgi:small redox-active disulfide protein 2